MCRFPIFKYFFQRPLIPIGMQDLAWLQRIGIGPDGKVPDFTHWLIGLLWCEDGPTAGWKVYVYPVAEGMAFFEVPPFFETKVPLCFDDAWRQSEEIRVCSRNDQLTVTSIHAEGNDRVAL